MDRVRRRSLRYIDASFRQQLEIDKLERKFIALSERIRAEKTRSRECQQNINRIVFRDPDLSSVCEVATWTWIIDRSVGGIKKTRDVTWFDLLHWQVVKLVIRLYTIDLFFWWKGMERSQL